MPPQKREQHESIHVFHHFDKEALGLLLEFFNVFDHKQERLLHIGERTMASNAELAQQLSDLGLQADKAKTEIVKKIADLEAAIAAGGGTTPEVDAALAALKGNVQALDDLNPDV